MLLDFASLKLDYLFGKGSKKKFEIQTELFLKLESTIKFKTTTVFLYEIVDDWKNHSSIMYKYLNFMALCVSSHLLMTV